MITEKHKNDVVAMAIQEVTTAGMPVVVSGAILGVSEITTIAASVSQVTTFAAASAGAGGEIPDATYLMYAVTAVDVKGKETLPSFIVGLTAVVDDILNLTWDVMAGAVAYRVYRGLSSLVAATVGMDLVLLGTVTTNALDDNGYDYTKYDETTPAFEEIRVKGSSIRAAKPRDPEIIRLIPGLIVPVVKRGVAEFPVDARTATGLPAMTEGTAVNWDAANKWITTEGAGGNIIAFGTATFGYDTASPIHDAVCVRFNFN